MADLPLEQKIFTTALTNDSLTILTSSNLKAVSIYNTSAVSGTVRGTLQVGATASTAITIAENESYNVVSQGTSVLDGITITAPAGCTLNVTGLG
tara:strand:- start:16197 stop:16481 length:285 start_codon:yes stop_codon:yes gene_type:complete